ncbi:MAG: DUF2157 domain-containing protein [Acidimicrobiia bacterium]|nr:DUF2157 domain-containing protein [Acidimicrobiia bacterium]
MSRDWNRKLDDWTREGLLDPEIAERIRRYESRNGEASGFRWPVLLALAFGALLIGAGILLFVAAHWDSLSPAQRMAIVFSMVAGFHLAGAAVASRWHALSVALHALGTVALGAAIALTGQIFHLAAHWPQGILFWAIGAAAGAALLRDWPQFVASALLAPAWIVSEWSVPYSSSSSLVICPFLLLLAFVYIGALLPGHSSASRNALCVIGSIAVLPLAWLAVLAAERYNTSHPLPSALQWLIALALPCLLAFLLRGASAWVILPFAAWAVALVFLSRYNWSLALHLWCAAGAIALTTWGLQEARPERINLGVAGFAMTVLAFYFSTLMDKLGRSFSLVSLGILFLLGGWLLEKARRRLIARIHGATA